MDDRPVVLQDLAVFNYEVTGSEVTVDLYGGPTNTCGVARFVLRDPERRRVALRDLERWRLAGTPLTLVDHGDRLSLLHPQSVFSPQLPVSSEDSREGDPSPGNGP